VNRAKAIRALRDGGPFDLLVIGGGAAGLGTAVEAASRGHRTALIEARDFAAGTSSRSTKLIHGGVRYLRQGNVRLVLEALRERGLLRRNAPHLVRERSFVIPAYGALDRAWYGLGLKVYDRLAGALGLSPSRILDARETRSALPNIEPSGLRGGVRYADGQFDDARLAVNLAQTAAEHGAAVANHCRCAGLTISRGRVSGALAQDTESGDEFEIEARAVLNAAGPFVDAVRRFDQPSAAPLVTVSQGIHLVLPADFLPADHALMVPKTADGRVLFGVPWQGAVVFGTTDTPVAEPSEEPRSLPDERAFVLEHARRYLERDPGASDVLSVFAGLRALARPGSAESSKISRSHAIEVSDSGMLTLAGGKWTTYRRMGEDAVTRAERVAGLSPRPSRSAKLPLHGAPAVAPSTAETDVYGTDAERVDAIRQSESGADKRLHPRLPYDEAEVRWQARKEMARSVEDILARRTRALFLDASAALEAAPRVAAILAEELDRDAEWPRRQTEAFAQLARGYVFEDPASRANG